MNLTGHGIHADLPPGWEWASVRQAPVELDPARLHVLQADVPSARDERHAGAATSAFPPAPLAVEALPSLPVVHLANFALPAARGDFGSGAVEVMGASGVFVALLEYGPENLGTPLFAREGVPRKLRLSDFHPLALQRALPGQAGYQEFFTSGHRAFCLYVVLGDRSTGHGAVAQVNAVLATIQIGTAG